LPLATNVTKVAPAALYGLTPQLESTPTDPPVLIDETATLEEPQVSIRYPTPRV